MLDIIYFYDKLSITYLVFDHENVGAKISI